MINNFKQIRSLLTFPNENSFYFLEIIKRRKENPKMLRHAKLIKDFYIYSLKEFDELEGKIIELCDENNARAYFRLNLRDSKKIAHQYLKRISELFITEDYKAIPKAYASVTGEFHSDFDKKWLIDIDKPETNDESYQYQLDFLFELKIVQQRITEIYQDSNKNDVNPILAMIPTKNGMHIITKPFRLDIFKHQFPNIDVHKDNPTILYTP